jgi:hypothetical protein
VSSHRMYATRDCPLDASKLETMQKMWDHMCLRGQSPSVRSQPVDKIRRRRNNTVGKLYGVTLGFGL